MLILFPWKPVVLACGLLSGLLLLGFIGSSLMEGKNPFSPDLSHTRLYATPDHAFRSVFESGTNVGAGYSCHPTGSDHLRSTRVPLHPVWPRPVARFPGVIEAASTESSYSTLADQPHSFSNYQFSDLRCRAAK